MPMLAALRESGKATDRKLRLFAAACCRRLWYLLLHERSRRAVEAGERFADGEVSTRERGKAFAAASGIMPLPCGEFTFEEASQARTAQAAAACSAKGITDRVVDVSRLTTEASVFESMSSAWALARSKGPLREEEWSFTIYGPFVSGADAPNEGQRAADEAVRAEHAVHSALVRELFGPLPFRPVTVAPPVLQWNSGRVVDLAEAAYGDRRLPEGTLDNNRLAVLADALEEAGCTDRDLLGHLRHEGAVHVRGCWCVDLVLGKR
jgi:hypothetical protein